MPFDPRVMDYFDRMRASGGRFVDPGSETSNEPSAFEQWYQEQMDNSAPDASADPAYLEQLKEQDIRQANPDYQASMSRADMDAYHGDMLPQGFASMAKAGAQLGTIGGKVADTSAIQDYATNMQKSRQLQYKRDQDISNRQDKMTGLRLKTLQYLQGKGIDAGSKNTVADKNNATKKEVAQIGAGSRQNVANTNANAKLGSAKIGADAKQPTPGTAGKERILSSEYAGKIADFDSAEKALDGLEAEYKKLASHKGAGLDSLDPRHPANHYKSLRDMSAQVIGTPLEKGKLSNEDYKSRYVPFMPDPMDTNEKAAYKFENLRKMIRDKKASMIDGANKAGYKTSGFDQQEPIHQEQGKEIFVPGKVYKRKGKNYTFDGKDFIPVVK